MNVIWAEYCAVASLVVGEFLERLPLLQEKFKPKRKNKRKKRLSRHTHKEQCTKKTLSWCNVERSLDVE